MAPERRECVCKLYPLTPYLCHRFYLPEVVADARQNFASSNVSLLPPLPVPPGPQTRRPSRDRSHWPSRRVLPANQVFQVEEDSSVDQSFASSSTPAQNDHPDVVPMDILHIVPREGPSGSAFSCVGPRPTRRATVLGPSPEKPRILNIDADMTPSKRREKSKSANDLNRLIRPISKVQFELDKRESIHVDNPSVAHFFV